MFGRKIVRNKKATEPKGLKKKHPRLSDPEVREAFKNKPEPEPEEVELTPEEEEVIQETETPVSSEEIPEIQDIRHSIVVDDLEMEHLMGYNKKRKAKGRAKRQYEQQEKNRRRQQFGRLDPARDYMIEYIIEAAEEAANEVRESYSAEYTEVVEHNILKVAECLNRLTRQASKKQAKVFKKKINNISNKTHA